MSRSALGEYSNRKKNSCGVCIKQFIYCFPCDIKKYVISKIISPSK